MLRPQQLILSERFEKGGGGGLYPAGRMIVDCFDRSGLLGFDLGEEFGTAQTLGFVVVVGGDELSGIS